MRGGTCPHCGRFIHEPVKGHRVLPSVIVGAVALVAALMLSGCSGNGVDLSGGLHDWLARGVHVSYSVSTVTVPEIHYPRAWKVAGPE